MASEFGFQFVCSLPLAISQITVLPSLVVQSFFSACAKDPTQTQKSGILLLVLVYKSMYP